MAVRALNVSGPFEKRTLVELEFGMLVFMEGGKLENPEKNPRSKTRTNQKLNPRMTSGRNRTRYNGWEASTLRTGHPAPQGITANFI